MGTFRRVEGEQAGPDALGILIPPGKRTFLILRPRSLLCDLVLCRSLDDLTFAQMSHDEASAAAQGLYRALRDWLSEGTGAIEPVSAVEGVCLRVLIGAYPLIVCARQPGKPYAPLVCADASVIAQQLKAILHPEGTREQELYFNLRFFER
jgi:hypothetical protein